MIILLILLVSCSLATKNTDVEPLTPVTISDNENITTTDTSYQKIKLINYTDIMHKTPFAYCETVEDCFCHIFIP